MRITLLPLLLLVLESARLSAQPVITNQPVNQAVVWGGNTTFSVMATGVGPLTYQWQLNGTNLPNNLISTVAGGNLFNNQPATNTILNGGFGVAQDGAGNLFIADTGNSVIRKMDTNGLMTIVAGNGSGSFSGDGGAATNAGLAGPGAVAVDLSGNLFIADSGNNRIRKVDTNGIITTVAGNGLPAYSGDNGVATNASIYNPYGVCVATNGNLFIADTLNNRIRKVDTNGIITSIAGTGVNNPYGVAMDSSNNLFIADSLGARILKVTAGGIVSTVAGLGSPGFSGTPGFSGDGGAPTSAKLNFPVGVAVDAFGNLIIADGNNRRVRKVGTNNIITTIAGNGTNGFSGDGGTATNANLSLMRGVSVDNLGNVYIADSLNCRIRKVGTNGVIATVAGRIPNDGDFATNATINSAAGIAFDSTGYLYIADTFNNRVRRINTNGIIATVAGDGIPAYSGDSGSATNASLQRPSGVGLDALGNLFIADTGNGRIRKVDTNGIITTVAGTGVSGLSGDGGAATNAKLAVSQGVTLDGIGNLFIADTGNGRIRKVDTNGLISTVASSFNSPQSVAVDSNGNLFVTDFFNYRVRKVNTNGVISTVAGNGSFGFSGDGGMGTNANLNPPTAAVVDSVGNIFIADTSNARIRKVNTNGIITTIAGNGVVGFAGDGGAGNNANLSAPRGLALDGVGNVYISDTGNNRVRKLAYVNYADQPSFILTNVTLDSMSNNYSVIVTSASGSVTSSVATVTLQLPPIIPAFTAGDGVCTFIWSAVSNLTYQLQYNLDLTTTNWIDLGSPITATNNSVSTTDAAGPDTQRFYRVRLVP